MSQPVNNIWLHRFAVLTALATFLLLGAGGLVTSHGVGMAVPDWPNTYGYNMFFFPLSRWIGGIFYEHTHRLIASGVGMLTGVLALWLFGRQARRFMRWTGLVFLILGNVSELLFPKRWEDGIVWGVTGLLLFGASFVWPRCEPSLKWLRRLGLIAFFAVVLQGVLGGLRVVLLDSQIGILHATLAQLFFVLLCAIALFTSKWWQQLALRDRDQEDSPASGNCQVDSSGQKMSQAAQIVPATLTRSEATLSHPIGVGRGEGSSSSSSFSSSSNPNPLLSRTRTRTRRRTIFPRRLFIGVTALILLQLILGATMRHQHAGLAIPDFPLAYGKLWPPTDPQSVAHYNEQRIEVTAANPITAFQIELQMAHRIFAVLILAGVALCAWQVRRLGSRPPEGGTPNWLEDGTPNKSVLRRLAWLWLGLIFGQVALGALTILSNKAADIATAHVLVGALSLANGAILCIISLQSLERAAGVPSAELSFLKGERAEQGNCRQDAGSPSKAARGRL